jgi:hypothetical protein
MPIKIHYESGAESVVSTPCFGLMYWLLEQIHLTKEPNLIEILRVGEVRLFCDGTTTVVGADDPKLFPTVLAAIERRWNKTPPIPEWITDREEQAIFILHWLKYHGDITEIEMDAEPGI